MREVVIKHGPFEIPFLFEDKEDAYAFFETAWENCVYKSNEDPLEIIMKKALPSTELKTAPQK